MESCGSSLVVIQGRKVRLSRGIDHERAGESMSEF